MKPYKPSNSDSGAEFEKDWCNQCSRHPVNTESKKQCPHLIKALCGEDNGKWFWRDGSPVCTAFRNRHENFRRHKTDKRQMNLWNF